MDVKDYDIVSENCATFVKDVLKRLGIDESPSLLDYVVQHLLSYPENIQAIRASPNAAEVGGGSDEEMVRSLVSNYEDIHKRARNNRGMNGRN